MKMGHILSLRAIVSIALMVGAVSASSQGARNVANFDIEVTVDSSSHEVRFKCIDGCVWETLSFGCGSDMDCTSSIDEYGTPAE
jgi:hypothetical protein